MKEHRMLVNVVTLYVIEFICPECDDIVVTVGDGEELSPR